MTTCNRCKKKVPDSEAETCWWCISDLCYECWDELGHCGHKEADELNEHGRKIAQPKVTMNSIVFYQTDDRYILDFHWVSFSFWKKRKYWALWDTMGRGHFQLGPLEVFNHYFS